MSQHATSIKTQKQRDEGKESDVTFSHQVGHDVMVAFHVFPHADDLQGGGAKVNVNATGSQCAAR